MSSLTLIPSSLFPCMVGRRSGYHDRDHVQAEGELCAMRVFNNWLRLEDGGGIFCKQYLDIHNMNDNTFIAKGTKAMAAAIKKLDKLEVLNLGDCLLKFGGTKLICNALKGRHPNLKDLILDSNEFRLKGGLSIIDAVKGKEKLAKLSIDGYQFRENGLKKNMRKMEEIGFSEIIGEVEDTEKSLTVMRKTPMQVKKGMMTLIMVIVMVIALTLKACLFF